MNKYNTFFMVTLQSLNTIWRRSIVTKPSKTKSKKMKRIFLLLSFITAFIPSIAQDGGKNLRSYLSYTTFDIPGQTPYIENVLAFENNSVVYKEVEAGRYVATIEITTIFKQNDTIKSFSKISLDSPVVADTSLLQGVFLNQQRFQLPNGEYNMEISIIDVNNRKQYPYKSEQTIVINYPQNQQTISGIQLVESFTPATKPGTFTKNGYDIIPLIYAFYPQSNNKLSFYAEVYNSDKLYEDGKYLVNYYIESFESKTKMDKFNYSKRIDVKNINVLFNTIDITTLPSGNYYLVVDVKDRTNNIVTSNSIFFQRSNPGYEHELDNINSITVENTFVNAITNIDTLREYIRCTEPISSESERVYAKSLVRRGDVTTMQQYLYNFWANRTPLNPQDGWENYLAQVRRVNMSFSTKTQRGYDTDRGRVYLKYGTPDKIVESYNEPGAYPYEIWHYYQLANQRNKKFVFMSKDIVTNSFNLIHSDAVGELANYRWQLEIYSRNYGNDFNATIDQTANPDTYGNRAGDLYENPR